MKNILVIDCETSIAHDGNPFSKSNKLMCVGTLFNDEYLYHDIEHSGLPYNRNLEHLSQLFSQAELIVGFNLKFDLHWIKRYLPDVKFKKVFDCQLAEFLLTNQQQVYPSLERCSVVYKLPPKEKAIEEYWNSGICTAQVHQDILSKRVLSDVKITKELYEQQLALLKTQNKYPLFSLQCDDLLVLQEMEFNGMSYDEDKAKELGEQTKNEITLTTSRLWDLYPYGYINWNSNDHVSAILYGGFINYPCTKPVVKVLKSGKISTRDLKDFSQHWFERLVTPLPNTEVKDTKAYTDLDIELINKRKSNERKPHIQRLYYVNEDVLKSLPATGKARTIIETCLRLSTLEKLSGTYYTGLSKLINEMEWQRNTIHGNFNQVVARTGRLSSSKPNLQNFASAIKPLFKTRYDY